MPDNLSRLRPHLQAFDFQTLFVEGLGWDYHRASREIIIDGATYTVTAVAEKRGVQILLSSPDPTGHIPSYATRRRIDREVTRLAREHLIIYTDADQTQQIWQWVKREHGKPPACREIVYHVEQTGDALLQSLDRITFSIGDEENLSLTGVTIALQSAFDRERLTKHFYDRFKDEHAAFISFVDGIQIQADREWYASIMLNRLMFVYFIQKQGFLDGDRDYLRNRLEAMRSRRDGSFLSFYRYFLKQLFHAGLGRPERDREPALRTLLGRVPYLNGGLFDTHQLEEEYSEIDIPDEAFERLFAFFDGYTWHLDDRKDRAGNEINPDVLGYIFEKYINQKQMGAYYTKEDITEYIAKNTIIPYLFNEARKNCAVAFRSDGYIWRLLRENPDRYIYNAAHKGVDMPLPAEIVTGLDDESQRGGWNGAADPDYALPNETWREHVARRRRYEEVWSKLVDGEVTSIDELITLNLDIRTFAQDVIDTCEGRDLAKALYDATSTVTVLDPTCGSGAFLFAALNILQPIYEACLDRMRAFIDEHDAANSPTILSKYDDFRMILAEVDRHPNRDYFVLKQIVLNNLYGVDIMEEAVEICKLRLFLKLVAQLETYDQIEPLPDIDFNIRVGNTLVGFATYDDARSSVLGDRQSKMQLFDDMERIDEHAVIADRAFHRFHSMQTRHVVGTDEVRDAKRDVRNHISALGAELDRYLATEYGVQPETPAFEHWRQTHQPFHWLVDFYGIMKSGGFNVVIGNPPYLEKTKLGGLYEPKHFATLGSRDIYAWVVERSLALVNKDGMIGWIIPVSFASSGAFDDLRNAVWSSNLSLWMSHFANRPSQLFTGAQNRLTILLTTLRPQDRHTYSTRYHRWDAKDGERASLFPLLQYVSLDNLARKFNGLFPKAGSPEAISILKKIDDRSSVQRFVVPTSSYSVYWVRVPGYFCQFFLDPPMARPEAGGPERPRGELNRLAARDEVDQRMLHAILNSSTYYQFFTSYSDGRHVNPSDVKGFPISLDVFQDSAKSILVELSKRLQACSRENTTRRRKSGLLIDSVDYAACKPIIDEIDCVLAKHYGFTDEERDFIVNYDIKYRLGNQDEDG